MKNIADLEVVRCDVEIFTETRKDRDEVPYTVSFIIVDGDEYRVAPSVLEQLQTTLKAKPELKTFKVSKTGEGKGTKYTVIALD